MSDKPGPRSSCQTKPTIRTSSHLSLAILF